MFSALFPHSRRPHTKGPAAAFFLVAATLGLTGCAAPATVVTEVAQAAFEDRITEDQVTDNKIKAGILKRFSDTDKSLLLDLSVDVWEGRVLLTGVLDDGRLRNTAVRLARDDDRIKAFYNAVNLVSKDEKETRRSWKEKAESGLSNLGDSANDFWIEAKIKGKLIATSGVSSVNYRWRSVNGTIYIIGRAGSTQELSTVLSVIRATEGVKGVEPHVRVKSAP